MSEAILRNMSVEYRPKKLSELIGQDDLVNEIRAGMSERIPCAVLLCGESGAGKSTIGKILKLAVNCTHGVFGEPCAECIENEQLINFIERNCADLGTVEDMRGLLPGLSNYPNYGRLRVILLDEAHGLGPKAQEALLLPTERGEEPNLFILCSTDPTKIKSTVKRRCSIFNVPNLKDNDIGTLVASVMAQAGKTVDTSGLVKELIRAGINTPGFIVQAVERFLNGAKPGVAIATQSGSSLDLGGLLQACSKGEWSICQRILGDATPSDADDIKRRLSGYFRKILLNPASGVKRLRVSAQIIHELSANNASTVYESGFQLSILTASIFKICMLIQEAAANK